MRVQSDAESSQPRQAGPFESSVPTQARGGRARLRWGQSFTPGRSSIRLAVCSRWPGIWRTATIQRGRRPTATSADTC